MRKRKGEEEKRRRGEEETNANPQSTIVNPQSEACARWRRELKAYLDGQLGWWPRRTVRRHLDGCAPCREELEAMRDFSRMLIEGDAEPLSPQLRARILAAVPETTPVSTRQPAYRPATRPLLLWGTAAAAALLCIVLYPAYLASTHSPLSQETANTASVPAASATTSGNFRQTAPLQTKSALTPSDMVDSPGGKSKEKQIVSAPSMPSGMAGARAPRMSPGMPGLSGAGMGGPGGAGMDGTGPARMKPGIPMEALPPNARSATDSAKDIAAADQAGNNTLTYDNAEAHAANGNAPASEKAAGAAGNSGAVTGASTTAPALPPPPAAVAPTKAQKTTAGGSFGSVAQAAKIPAPSFANKPGEAGTAASKGNIATNAQNAESAPELVLLVVNVEQTQQTIATTARAAGGSVANVTEVRSSSDKAAVTTLTLKVPAAGRQNLLERIAHMGEERAQFTKNNTRPRRAAVQEPRTRGQEQSIQPEAHKRSIAEHKAPESASPSASNARRGSTSSLNALSEVVVQLRQK